MTVGFDVLPYPFSDGRRLDLEPQYAELRNTPGLVRVQLPYGDPCWLVTRYQEARFVLGDSRFSRAAAVGPHVPRIRPQEPTGGGILQMDPPEHSRVRRVAAKAFTARRVEQLRPRAREVVHELLDAMIQHGSPADIVEHLGLPLPVMVICELLGVPYEDRTRFRVWSDAFLSTTALAPDQVARYAEEFFEYMAGLIAQRRAEPADDLLTDMIRARDEEGRISEEELVSLAVGVLVAGHETTATQLPNFIYVLDRHRDQWDLLCQQPDLVLRAVEELMRWIPLGVGAAFPRYATEDVEVGGVVIRAGEAVLVSIAAANRDERVFEQAEKLDVTREGNSHIGFGHGAHHCLGAQLARMELQEGLRALVTRLPQLRVAADETELAWKTGMLVRGFIALPVTW